MSHRPLAFLMLGLGALTGGALAPACAQPMPTEPPPLVLSPNLTGPWEAQLTPGPVPIYRPPVRLPATASALPASQTMSEPPVMAFFPATTVAPPQTTPEPNLPTSQVEARGASGASKTALPAEFLPQEVAYRGGEGPGTVIIDTKARLLYLVESDGKARRYGVGVGRPGFAWAGTHEVTRKAEWPDWYPPVEMRERQPGLPTMMPGGPQNPLGARALYLGDTLYRIHGTSQPWTIGHAVSSGCIRMRNEDVTDLYERVPVGAKVVVM